MTRRIPSYSFADHTNAVVMFDNGTLTTDGPVVLTLNAASNLASALLQWTTQTRTVPKIRRDNGEMEQ